MRELLDKQVNAQKRITSGVHASSCKPMKKVCDENERNKQRNKKIRHVHKNVIGGRKLFIMSIPKTSENNLHKLKVNDYEYNKGTICLVNG